VTTPAERAVLDAVLSHDSTAMFNAMMSPRLRQAAMDYRSTAKKDDDLRIAPQPDIAALDHAVAEAVDVWMDHAGLESVKSKSPWGMLCAALYARRAALAPKPRWTVRNPKGSTVWELVDNRCGSSWSLPFDVSLGVLEAIAALLNAQSKEKP
jgi:hypothetical protein